MRYVVFVLLIAAAPLGAFAQFGAEPITVRISPQYPQPFEAITITPQSTLLDLAASTVTISVNGTVIQKSSGGKSATYTMGAAGTTATIVVTVTGPAETHKKTVVLQPAGVALVVEPISTTHPFYSGASLVASEGRLRLIAMPEFRNNSGVIPPQTLTYTWKAGDRLLTEQSGVGRSVITAVAPIRYRDTTVTLTVSTPDNSVVGKASVTISPVDPLMLVYRNSALAGPLFDSAIPSIFTMEEGEESFRAVPYFFPQTPPLTWRVNGEYAGAEPVVTVRTTGDTAGSATLSVQGSEQSSFQSAERTFKVQFEGATDRTSFFGL